MLKSLRNLKYVRLAFAFQFTYNILLIVSLMFFSKEKCQRLGPYALGDKATEYFRERVLWAVMGGQEGREGIDFCEPFILYCVCAG